jgi:hypothetical protein
MPRTQPFCEPPGGALAWAMRNRMSPGHPLIGRTKDAGQLTSVEVDLSAAVTEPLDVRSHLGGMPAHHQAGKM